MPKIKRKILQEIAEAYEILSDDNKRAIYDREGIDGIRNGGGGGGNGGGHFHHHGQHFHFSDPNEIFRQFFGTGSIFDIMEEMMGGHRHGTFHLTIYYFIFPQFKFLSLQKKKHHP